MRNIFVIDGGTTRKPKYNRGSGVVYRRRVEFRWQIDSEFGANLLGRIR